MSQPAMRLGVCPACSRRRRQLVDLEIRGRQPTRRTLCTDCAARLLGHVGQVWVRRPDGAWEPWQPDGSG